MLASEHPHQHGALHDRYIIVNPGIHRRAMADRFRPVHWEKIMTENAQTILAAHESGLITEGETILALDEQEIRGTFRDDGSFIGYDYRNQGWIDTQ